MAHPIQNNNNYPVNRAPDSFPSTNQRSLKKIIALRIFQSSTCSSVQEDEFYQNFKKTQPPHSSAKKVLETYTSYLNNLVNLFFHAENNPPNVFKILVSKNHIQSAIDLTHKIPLNTPIDREGKDRAFKDICVALVERNEPKYLNGALEVLKTHITSSAIREETYGEICKALARQGQLHQMRRLLSCCNSSQLKDIIVILAEKGEPDQAQAVLCQAGLTEEETKHSYGEICKVLARQDTPHLMLRFLSCCNSSQLKDVIVILAEKGELDQAQAVLFESIYLQELTIDDHIEACAFLAQKHLDKGEVEAAESIIIIYSQDLRHGEKLQKKLWKLFVEMCKKKK